MREWVAIQKSLFKNLLSFHKDDKRDLCDELILKMLIITIKRNNLKSKVNLKTKMVCEIITIRSMSQLSTIRWQVNFLSEYGAKKTCMFGEGPSSFFRDQLEEKKLHLSWQNRCRRSLWCHYRKVRFENLFLVMAADHVTSTQRT